MARRGLVVTGVYTAPTLNSGTKMLSRVDVLNTFPVGSPVVTLFLVSEAPAGLFYNAFVSRFI